MTGHRGATFEDLCQLAPELGDGLRKLLTFDGDVRTTYLRTFTYEREHFGEKKVYELKDNGANIELTNDNREGNFHSTIQNIYDFLEYVTLFTKYYMDTAVEKHIEALLKGFNNVCGGEILSWFNWQVCIRVLFILEF